MIKKANEQRNEFSLYCEDLRKEAGAFDKRQGKREMMPEKPRFVQ